MVRNAWTFSNSLRTRARPSGVSKRLAIPRMAIMMWLSAGGVCSVLPDSRMSRMFRPREFVKVAVSGATARRRRRSRPGIRSE